MLTQAVPHGATAMAAAESSQAATGSRLPRHGGRLLCLGLGALVALLLQAHLDNLPKERGAHFTFVGSPDIATRHRVTSWRAAEPDSEAALRERVANLEQRLAQKLDPSAASEGPSASPLADLLAQCIEELPEIAAIKEARLGMTDSGTRNVFEMGDASKKNPIYRRKYEVMGMVMTQQEEFKKACRRAQKAAAKSPAMKELIELSKRGGNGMSRREVKAEMARLAAEDDTASIIFSNILPQVAEDPVSDVLGQLAAIIFILVAVILLGFCALPPVLNPDE
eukprot:TRINITY_DN107293_c0_g1_i1.p1 TRINITY_DN107293_c0_g1~~TRINITY_DN107293_c0_g1_i1.p1  ORF type:complete len:281 (-),score=56.47 TRINITY_DN107293_c0_g1_i1:115-957(-)